MRLLRWSLIQYDWCFIRRENWETERHTEGRRYEEEERRWSPAGHGERPDTDPSLAALGRDLYVAATLLSYF